MLDYRLIDSKLYKELQEVESEINNFVDNSGILNLDRDDYGAYLYEKGPKAILVECTTSYIKAKRLGHHRKVIIRKLNRKIRKETRNIEYYN